MNASIYITGISEAENDAAKGYTTFLSEYRPAPYHQEYDKIMPYHVVDTDAQIQTMIPYDEMNRITNEVISYFTCGPDRLLFERSQKVNSDVTPEAFMEKAMAHIAKQYPQVKGSDTDILRRRIYRAIFQNYVLEPLINSDEISDIMVLAPNNIRVKVGGERYTSDIKFIDGYDYQRFISSLATRNNLNPRNAINVFSDITSNPNFRMRFNITTPWNLYFTPLSWIALRLLAILAGIVFAWFLSVKSTVAAIAIGIVIAKLPDLMLNNEYNNIREDLIIHFPETIRIISGYLSVGLIMPKAFEMTAKSAKPRWKKILTEFAIRSKTEGDLEALDWIKEEVDLMEAREFFASVRLAIEDVVLEYLDESTDKSEWLDTGVTLTVRSSGDIEAPEVSLDSNCLNHMLRIKTDSGELSDIFYVNCNTYDKHEFPEALTGMTETEQYGYTAGDIIYLVPDLESNKKITEIRWQVSTNGGQSYKTFETIQPDNGDSLILQIDAECEETGNLYRYAVNPVGNKAAYSSPIETIVYEDYSIDGSTLTIKNAGPSGIMNDYKSGRLSNIRPWEAKVNIIRSVVLENIGETGKQAFKDFSKLKKIDFGDDILTIGEESFKDCTGLQAVTIPAGVAEVEKDTFIGCDDLREVKFEDPDTIINASENTIPQNDNDASAPNATVSKKSLTQNEHSYPIIYGYKGIAKDEKNNIEKTSAGSTAYDYSVATGRAFYPLGAIDSSGYERPIKWDYVTDSAGNIIRTIVLMQ